MKFISFIISYIVLSRNLGEKDFDFTLVKEE